MKYNDLQLELLCPDAYAMLATLTAAKIRLKDVTFPDAITLRLTVSRIDLNTVFRICRKKGIDCRVLAGKVSILRRLVTRPVLLIGLPLIAALMLWIPTRVFFLEVQGNIRVPARQILAAAEAAGLCFGIPGREIRSQQLKNALLQEIPQLQWAGINTRGCVAVISVQEKQPALSSPEKPAVSSIVASCDGIVISATAQQGSLRCRPGQAVTEGEVLISGYTDCGRILLAGRAQGEIFARTTHSLTVVAPEICTEREDVTHSKTNFSLIIGKKRINFRKDSGISGSSCGRMYEEYYITLPGGFRLPVMILKQTDLYYESGEVPCQPQAAQLQMTRWATDYLSDQLIAGTVEAETCSFSVTGGCCRLEAVFVCTEMIGRQKVEQIGETNEQTSGTYG